MKRPVRVEHFRWLGDKRNQIVYDLDEIADEEIINELIESEMYLVFSPDTLPEARNRDIGTESIKRVCDTSL